MSDQLAGWSNPDGGLEAAAVVDHSLPTGSGYAVTLAGRRGLLPLRPMATGEVLDGAVAVTRAFPRPVLAFAAGIAIVSALLDLTITLTLLGPVSVSSSEVSGNSDAATQLLGQTALSTGLNLLVALVTQAVMAGVMTAVVGRALFGTPTSLRQTWDELRPRLWRLIALSLLVGLTVYGTFFGGVLLFALLAATGAGGAVVGVLVLVSAGATSVWLYTRWALAPASMVLEKQGIRQAMKRSSALVRRSFWRVLGILLLALAISLFVAFVVQVPFQLLGYSPLSGFRSTYHLTTKQAVLGAVSGAVASTLVAPFVAGVRALLYIDRRMRAEGLDVALVAAVSP